MFPPRRRAAALVRRYRGTIQVDKVGQRLRAVNVVGLEQYLYGVVPAEVPDDWGPEVLKAQSVAARSYALATRKIGGAFDLFPDVRSQVYRGVDEEEESTNAAVDETAGEVLMYGARLVIAYFHSTSGGRTASVEDVWVGSKRTPYLTGVADPYDSISPHHTWGPVVMPAGRLQRLLKAPGRLLDVRTTTNASARADTVVGLGTGGEGSAARAGDVRRELGLRSTWFRVGVLRSAAREAARVRRDDAAHGRRARCRWLPHGVPGTHGLARGRDAEARRRLTASRSPCGRRRRRSTGSASAAPKRA